MTKRRGRLIEELSIVQRVRTGYQGLLRSDIIKPNSPIVVHRRALKGMTDYNAPDPREQYAVSLSEVKGTLPERIVYKALKDRRLLPVPFSFQSTLTGGRLHLGGLVADFLSEAPPVVIRIQGSYWHGEFDRQTGNLLHGDIVQGRKDDEQGQILNAMGYAVIDFWEFDVYDPYILQSLMVKWVDPLLTGMTM